MVEKGLGPHHQHQQRERRKGQAGQTNYSAAKAGMHGFSMALAQELATKGVDRQHREPWHIGTDMVKAIRPDVLEKIVTTAPSNALLASPARSLPSFAWLASDEGGYAGTWRRLLG